jgi:two-component system, NtrC family, response regulator AtoC
MQRHFENSGLVPTLFMTAYGDIDQAVRLVRAGALDYVTKPFDLDAFVETLQGIASRARSPAVVEADNPFGRSPAMAKIAATLKRSAASDLPILLLGETGTGKEVAARFAHDQGPRRTAPFVPVNCGALPADLADSMLFGHERGSFTGAVGTHRGFLEETLDGTLFLDEIGDLPSTLQVKLLRVLETREFRRLGGSATRKFEGRIICATNRDLEAMVADGAFREDLWFRINVIACNLPPLRERSEDIPQLLEAMVHAAANKTGQGQKSIEQAAFDAALRHRWPGNIRELINRVDRAVALGEGSILTRSDLFPDGLAEAAADPQSAPSPDDTLADVREAAERAHIRAALERTSGSPKDAAQLLGISRTTLWEKMRRYGLDED